MINLILQITNPWSKGKFKSLFCYFGRFSEHKAWEVQLIEGVDTVAEVRFNWTLCEDHAGVELELGLFGYEFNAKVYDTRHWDHEVKDWEVYNEDEQEDGN